MSTAARAAIFAVGMFHLGFAIFHLRFWRLFRWKEELARLGHLNRDLMQVLNITLTSVFFAIAAVAFVAPEAMRTEWLVALAILWLLRAAQQLVFFRRLPARTNAGLTALFLAGAALPLVAIVL